MKNVYIYLQINGVNLEKVTHNEAVECFVRAKETVCLKVQKGAHAEIMVSACTIDVFKFQTLVSFQIGLPSVRFMLDFYCVPGTQGINNF